MRKTKLPDVESYCEGNLDVATISYFLKNLDNFKTSQKTRHRLKVVLIELVSNILVHSDTQYGSVSIQQEQEHYVIRAMNFTSPDKVSNTIAQLGHIKTLKDPRQEYLGRLSTAGNAGQVSLGLLEIYRLSNGNMEIKGSQENGRTAINFIIRLNDEI